MPGPEATIERAFCRHAKKHGWKNEKVKFLTKNGAPDRLFGRNGVSYFIEFKAPGERPTTQQERRHDELRRVYGFIAEWTDSFEEACDILGIPLT